MTRYNLKSIIKNIVLNEIRSREKIVPTGAALRMAADKLRAKQAELDAQKAAVDQKGSETDKVPSDPIEKHIYHSGKLRSKFNNIMHRINDLNDKIAANEREMVKKPGEGDGDYIVRVSRLAVDADRLNIQRMEELKNLQDLNAELSAYIASPK